jgi:signal transduction histidine kinase
MVRLLFVHAVVIAVFARLRGFSLVHAVQEGAIVAGIAILAAAPWKSRKLKASLGAIGLITASAVLVHISGGSIEMHFHFFFALGVLTLYQDWFPFLVALGYVVLHHGVMGIASPESVYNHPAAWANPWKWALVHGFFVTAASAAMVISWRLSEVERSRAEDYRTKLHDADLRRRQAMEINDNIVQGLTVAKLSLELNRTDDTLTALDETLQNARGIISELLGEDDDKQIEAGELVRAHAALLQKQVS